MKNNNSILVLFVLWRFLNIANGIPIDQNDSGYQFIPETDGLYKYHDTPSEWSNAVETCEKESAILFHPMDEQELITMASFWANLENNFTNVLWLGVRKSDNSFKTITGVPISNTFNLWNNQQTENCYEDCVEGSRTLNSVWRLYARQCLKKSAFVCKMTVPNTNNQSRTPIDYEVMPYNQISKPDYHFIPRTNGLYKYHKKPREWEAAVVICDEEGANLFYPVDESELDAVTGFWRNKENETFRGGLLLDMKKAKNNFRTMSGIPISKVFNKWIYGEPNNINGKENCVEVITRSTVSNNSWGLNDISCWVTRRYICKLPVKQDDQPSTSNFGYGYSELLGKAYKLHLTPKSWNEAQAVCQAEASDLAVINSPEEAAYIVGLTNRINYSILENFTHGIILLGFHRQNVEHWQTVQGKSLSSIKYKQPWGKQQPDRGNGVDCGAMFYNGHLAEISCDRKALFICEHVVDNLDFISEPDIS